MLTNGFKIKGKDELALKQQTEVIGELGKMRPFKPF
jgi:hypothetical protein